MATFSKMICLVGENPLPIYLGIQQFAADDAGIIFVHSSETEKQTKAIAGKLGKSRTRVELSKLQDPYDPKELALTMDGLKKAYPNAGLNYTGGTKVMSAFAVRSWGGALTNAFYLEEARGVFHFGDGSTEKLKNFHLQTQTLCKLHDVVQQRESWSPSANLEDIQRIWFHYEGRRPYLPEQVKHVRQFKTPEIQAKWREFLGILTDETRAKWDAVPVPESNNRYKEGTGHGSNFGIYERMAEFAATKWLERLVECLVKELYPNTQVVPSWYFSIGGQQFESDGMVVLNSRLYYFSAATSDKREACKEKMFEAAYRARQIGGGLARACVVSLASTDEEGDICAACNISFNDPHFRIFGKNDVGKWMEGDISTLEEFLNS